MVPRVKAKAEKPPLKAKAEKPTLWASAEKQTPRARAEMPPPHVPRVVAKLFAAFKLVNLKAHPVESRICFPCIEYLGHNIGSLGGLTPNEVKVAAIIRALPNPSNISELRRVLGFANYYRGLRGYVPHLSEIAKPLTDLLKKDVKWDKWEWTAERASAWCDLKDALCCPDNALRHPDRNVRYVLHTDWSQKGLSAVLGHVDPKTGTEYLIACTSRSCNVHEAHRYGSYKGEMMAAVWGDVYAITEEHLSFAGALEEDPILLIAGFECADLSPAGSRKGLQGSKSSTFYPLLSVLASLQRMRSSYAFPLAYLIENTATQYAYGSSRAMKDSFHELCAKIGSPVVLLDAATVGSYAHRLRNYWSNLVSSSALQCVLDSFERDPDLKLSDVLYTTNPQICTKTCSYPWCTANVPGKLLKVLPTLVARVDSYAFRSRPNGEGQGQILDEEGNLVPLTLEERERILGYPTGSTDIPAISFHARHHILGSCFYAFAVSHQFACREFLSLAAQHLAVERQESSTSTDPNIWMDDHTLAFLHDPGMDLSMHSDAERKRILRRASSYVMTGKLLY
ncbi:hypothetical protein CEUSTIGMA_g12968.t1 [Chlamydomonas eustigma]|uniref:Reverse transcriptase/retrotransposon-derived protein RNase H-like domain-containing protein n=1 Tax=Chlamydomonas eustigma TaxID=1157962 RepID=A0A250XRB5_9CHLO|nr:hypothetical protein CEUSTIGMA_g12968.t1 [Chlamydomonas eustigma]|eukprot:GAX85553.1 hypothetical protein CEUSTIGMA_g12968.t1 [Chlamydomonas eustigma]